MVLFWFRYRSTIISGHFDKKIRFWDVRYRTYTNHNIHPERSKVLSKKQPVNSP